MLLGVISVSVASVYSVGKETDARIVVRQRCMPIKSRAQRVRYVPTKYRIKPDSRTRFERPKITPQRYSFLLNRPAPDVSVTPIALLCLSSFFLRNLIVKN